MTDIVERLRSDQQFYEREYKTAKSRHMALVAFGAYTAVVKLLEEYKSLAHTDEGPAHD